MRQRVRSPRRALPLLVALPLAAGCAELAVEAPQPAPSSAEIARRLPASAGEFQRGATVEHEAERPGFGTDVDYATRSRTAVASVQIYDRGSQVRIPDDPAAPEIEAELDRSVAETLEAVGRRPGRRLAERERATEALPEDAGPGLRCAVLRGSYGRMPVTQKICVGGAAGKFLKVQMTTVDRTAPAVDTGSFLAAVVRAARGRPRAP
ncbi:hypothetical protein [Caldovatus aquaticus]|uniref:Lipoprotein n=1 Tax=Caldovatus aquaticus TaxID=2865671 RepID=A0ABS7F0B4_9PROT|nr:hypothetical protein [Caldovatus aquaticus]MBW8269071.1 hypothetical protein [Caldovatus aquaticus]